MEPGEPISLRIPMVSIAAMGGVAQIWTTYERLAVEAYLRQLKDHGYFVLDFSYFRIKQLQAREKQYYSDYREALPTYSTRQSVKISY